MKGKILLFVLAAFLITNMFYIDDADAVPAFARRYKISCNTCHAPFPKLKPYGDDFAGAGFILQENKGEIISSYNRICSLPHFCISSMIGNKLSPKSVIEYSTRGGTSGNSTWYRRLPTPRGYRYPSGRR